MAVSGLEDSPAASSTLPKTSGHSRELPPLHRLGGSSLSLSLLEVRSTLTSDDAPFFPGLLRISFPLGISLYKVLACLVSSWCLASVSGNTQTYSGL